MTTPERPSLADTLARIDAALAERAPGSGPTIAEVNTARERLDLPQLDVRSRGGITENGKVLPWRPYLQLALDEAARQSAAQMAATVKRINAKAAAPPLPPGPEPEWGWLGRLLNRLFT